MNQHRLELKNAQEAREREREMAKEIQDGDLDEDDLGGEFEGMWGNGEAVTKAICMSETGEQAGHVERRERIGGTSFIVLTCLTNHTLVKGWHLREVSSLALLH